MDSRDNPKKIEKITRDEYRQYLIRASVIVIAAAVVILFYFCVKRYSGLAEGIRNLLKLLEPLLIGFAMAFLMNPIMKLFERQFLKQFLPGSKDEKKTRVRVRTWSSILSLLILIGVIVVLLVSVIPQFYSTATYLADNIDKQLIGVMQWADELTKGKFHAQIAAAENNKAVDDFVNKVVDIVRNYLHLGEENEIVSTLTTWGMSIGKTLVNILLGIIVSVYVLVSKERFKMHTKMLIYGIFPPKGANVVMDISRKARDVFYGFIIGKLIDSLIIGVICYFSMLILRFPYPVLCSVIIGFTNIIPVFGPYIGAIPTTIIIFLTDPVQGIYFLIFVIVLQQVDGNIIGPKILGDSTGISAFWVVFAIVVFGGMFGFFGMLLGVPTVALLYYIGGKVAHWMLKKRGIDDSSPQSYLTLDHVDPDSREIVPKSSDIIRESPISVVKNIRNLNRRIGGWFRKRKDKK